MVIADGNYGRCTDYLTRVGLPDERAVVENMISDWLPENASANVADKRDYVSFGDLSDSKTVMAQLPSWFAHYNTVHPHSALNYMSPRMFREHQLTNATCPKTKG